ncbi:MAG: MoxR family ATPase, partial [Planctomycetota bacterium]
RHGLPDPFFVLATQNPLEQEGTYPLPEAQLDRFMFQILIRYPTETDELEVIRRSSAAKRTDVSEVLHAEDIRSIGEAVRMIPAADHILRYALRLVRATRVGEAEEPGAPRPKVISDYVSWGAGPRASEFMVLAARAHALISGGTHVTPEDIRAVAHPILRNRILTNFNAEADQISPDTIIDGLLEGVPVEGASSREASQMDAALR